jgi:hypothetical protein
MIVTPAKAGVHFDLVRWIPAFAGMTAERHAHRIEMRAPSRESASSA